MVEKKAIGPQGLKKTVLIIYSLFLFFLIIFSRSSLDTDSQANIKLIVVVIEIGLYIFSFLVGLIYFRINSESLYILLLVFLSIFVYFITRDKSIALMAIAIFALRNFDQKEISKFFLITNVVAFFSIISLHFMGILQSVYSYSDGTTKDSLGFGQANTLGVTLLVINVALMYTYRERLLNWLVIFILAIDYIFLSVAYARSSILLIIISSLMFFALKYRFFMKIGKNKLIYMFVFFLILCFAVSFLFSESRSLYVSGSFLSNLDQEMSGRLKLGQYFITNFPITFLGRYIQYYVPNSTNYGVDFGSYLVLDNSYLKLIINFGIIFSILISFWIFHIFYKNIQNDNYWIILPMLTFLILGITEQSMLYFWVNFSLFLSQKGDHSKVYLNKKHKFLEENN